MIGPLYRERFGLLLHALRRRVARLRTLPHRIWTRLIESDHRLYDLHARLNGYKEERERVANVIGYEPNLRPPERSTRRSSGRS